MPPLGSPDRGLASFLLLSCHFPNTVMQPLPLNCRGYIKILNWFPSKKSCRQILKKSFTLLKETIVSMSQLKLLRASWPSSEFGSLEEVGSPGMESPWSVPLLPHFLLPAAPWHRKGRLPAQTQNILPLSDSSSNNGFWSPLYWTERSQDDHRMSIFWHPYSLDFPHNVQCLNPNSWPSPPAWYLLVTPLDEMLPLPPGCPNQRAGALSDAPCSSSPLLLWITSYIAPCSMSTMLSWPHPHDLALGLPWQTCYGSSLCFSLQNCCCMWPHAGYLLGFLATAVDSWCGLCWEQRPMTKQNLLLASDV